MGIISGVTGVADKLSSISQGEFSGESSSEFSMLETAYIVVKDDTNVGKSSFTTATTKSFLSGLSSDRSKALSESKQIKVQFNPDSLNFSYSSGGSDKKDKTSISPNEDGSTPQAKPEDKQENLSISMKLVFDRSIYIDSSVQPEVEQFLAILKKHYMREITFYWGTMNYKGIVKSISAEYVLFNKYGIPMRANVDLKMEVNQ
jgi:hypothetical protein